MVTCRQRRLTALLGDVTVDPIAEIAERQSLAVVVTDSGLGGLSVAADVERLARATGRYLKLRIVFASALPELRRGYNTFGSEAAKVRVFDDALAGMVRSFSPDVLLVACNTLSVLLPRVRATRDVPTLGIVELGVEMMEERLLALSPSTAIVFATETTAAAGVHSELLAARGIDPSRIVVQACPLLAREIELDAAGPAVAAMIDHFVAEAVERMPHRGDAIVAGLCCTHYGYRAAHFGAALRRSAWERVEVVDPNERMSLTLFPADRQATPGHTEVSVEVVSRALILDEEVRSIAALIDPISPACAAALRGYERRRDLFPFDDAAAC